jgi:hypothetical protein
MSGAAINEGQETYIECDDPILVDACLRSVKGLADLVYREVERLPARRGRRGQGCMNGKRRHSDRVGNLG